VSPKLDPADIANWAIRHGRVVIILDALDQVSDTSRIKALSRFLNEPLGKKCRVVLTARSYAVSEKRNTLFRVPGWRYGRIDGFDRTQQEAYLHDLYENDLSELFPNYYEVQELLRIPVVLSMIRGLAEQQAELKPFRTRAELYLQASYHMVQLAGTKLREDFDEDIVLDLEEILAAVAFEMMSGERYDYAVRGPDRVRALRKAAGRRCGREITHNHWEMVRTATGLTKRCILEGGTEQSLSFKHRGMMEFYCGLHLARNRQEGWVAKDVEDEGGEDRSLMTSATKTPLGAGLPTSPKPPTAALPDSGDLRSDPVRGQETRAQPTETRAQPTDGSLATSATKIGEERVRSGDPAVRRFAADPNWYWAFRFAIEMPSTVWQEAPDTLAASLAELFQVQPKGRLSGNRGDVVRRVGVRKVAGR